MMLRATIAAMIALTCGACDPIRVVSASREIPAPLDPTCVLETLRMQETVRSAGISEAGTVWAELEVPEDLECPEPRPEVGVELGRNEVGELEVTFSMHWVGRAGSAEYRAYVQRVIEDLRDEVIERCGG
jgi:hypothetical protein